MEALLIIERKIRESLENELKRSGLMYRIFSRVKDPNSIREKIDRKKYNQKKLMTDVIGFRITTYFNDDVEIISTYFRSTLDVFDDNYDELKPNIFEPIRKNLTCNMDSECSKYFDELRSTDLNYLYTANTYEIQFRTTLSEGWHEVEHNMRYKCKEEWNELLYENRIFNGIYAALESLDHSMKTMFDDLAYSHYKQKNWEAMIRNAFRLRFLLNPLSSEIASILTNNEDISKQIFKINRTSILKIIIDSKIRMSFSMDNLIFLLNYLVINNVELYEITPTPLLDDFNFYFKEYSFQTFSEKQLLNKIPKLS